MQSKYFSEADRFEDLEWDEIKTLIIVAELHKLLIMSDYDKDKTEKLITGFTRGFCIEYEGPRIRQDTSQNLPLRDIVTKTDLWNKVMKEVKLGRYAGPFKKTELPFENYIQSPIGLVPKAGDQTRLIFHLSYDFKNGNKSVNACTLKEKCTVKYRDLDHFMRNCLKLLQGINEKGKMFSVIFYSKSDLKSAFRILPLSVQDRPWLVMMTEDPETGECFYFIEKCLPFGASISCALFQEFSNALQHITEYLIGKKDRITNHLDDFLFIALLKLECDRMMETFFKMCKRINCLISMEKTEFAEPRMIFLGVLLDGLMHYICVPEDKQVRAISQLKFFMGKKAATIKEIQVLTGLLNFLNRAIVPGRTFTRRMYAKLRITDKNGAHLKQYHHLNIGREFKG